MVESFKINETIKNRWSPRAMSGETLTKEEYLPLFEAARLAPSCYNSQPWRFLIVKKGSLKWDDVYLTLNDFNKEWAKNAGMLVILVSRKEYEHIEKRATKHSLDAGAAWENLALEASTRKIVVHAMEGFDEEKLRINFNIPSLYHLEIVIAIGKQAPIESLPKHLQVKEKPKERKPLSEIINEDEFNFN